MSSPHDSNAQSRDDVTARCYVLGVDGGGTKTEALLAEIAEGEATNLVAKSIAGSSNLVAVGRETAFANLKMAVQDAADQAGVPLTSISAAVLALAGSGNPTTREQIEGFVSEQLGIGRAEIIHDGRAVLEAGSAEGWGIALIAGTGAVAYGRNPAGQTHVVGGWGYWFGDEGSAYWLGQSALRAVSQADDGRAGPTGLTPAILSRLEVAQPRDLLTRLSTSGNVRQAIAELAEVVCDQAGEGDAVASSILNEAADHWCNHISTLAEQLKLTMPVPLCYAGGVFCGSSLACELLIQRLNEIGFSTNGCTLVRNPAEGCVSLAARLGRE